MTDRETGANQDRDWLALTCHPFIGDDIARAASSKTNLWKPKDN